MRRAQLSHSVAIALCFASVGCRQILGIDDAVDRRDAAVDATAVTLHPYVVTSYAVPTTNGETRLYGFDLNGDGSVDNQLGVLLAALAGQGINSQAAVTRAVDRGDIIQLVGIQTTNFTAATGAELSLYRGENPVPLPCSSNADTVCRRHLDRAARFTVSPTASRYPALVGDITAGAYVAGPGTLTLPVVVFGLPAAYVTLVDARMRTAVATARDINSLDIGGAVPVAELEANLLPTVALQSAAVIARDCTSGVPPECGCMDNSPGKVLINLLDGGAGSRDCLVSVAEIRNNSVVQSLLAPDVTVEGESAVSFGVRMSALAVTFTVDFLPD